MIWTLAALAAFAATRAFILLGFGPFVTDMPLYQSVATASAQGLTIYCDHWFPYPPLAVPLVTLPGRISVADPLFTQVFKGEMLFFDFACFLGVWAFLKWRLKIPAKEIAAALTFYCCLGVCLPHLIFERLDIPMTALFMWALFFFTAPEMKGRPMGYLLFLAAALLKLIPLFIIPLFMIIEMFSDDGRRWPNPRRAMIPILWLAIPFALVIVGYSALVCEKVVEQLSAHGARGIQIESNWALPLIYLKVFQDWRVEVQYIYGAFHITDSQVPHWYLVTSKYAGFAALGLFYAFLFRRFRRGLAISNKLAPQDYVYLFYIPCLIMISTQRVLSPQYLMWLMPTACIQFALARHKWAVVLGAGVTFGLTYVVFDIGFFPILGFHPWYSLVLLVRNAALALWLVDLLRRVLRTLRLQRRAAIAGT